jgi:tripartite-type tricarboxylate transporter receptor subunit TctC
MREEMKLHYFQRLIKTILLALFVFQGLSNIAYAQIYPSKSIRLIVPFSPGGGNDTVARAIAQQMSQSLGQAVIVENKPGAGGVLGADLAAKAPADGYTIFLGGVGSLAVNPQVMARIPYDPIKDFAPIILLATAPSVVAVNTASQFKTIQEMTAFAKTNPRKLNYASNGNGSSAQIATVIYESMADVELTHVPYKGLAPALTDLLSGQVQLMFSSTVAITPHIQAGRLRALAVTSSKRSPLLPHVPTLAESGLPGYEAGSWYGLLVPTGTPDPIIQRLNQDAAKALNQAKVKESLIAEGAEVIGGSTQDFSKYIRLEYARIGKLIKAGQLQIN